MNKCRAQKESFLQSEGDQWFQRNHPAITTRKYDSGDPIIESIAQCLSPKLEVLHDKCTLLEIGCGEAKRLQYLSHSMNIACYGIEPSAQAVAVAKSAGLTVVQGTADNLPYPNHMFAVLIFGFCLYLCDREDLFKIVQEANRVLKPTGWLIIQDFFSITPNKNKYHHLSGIYSYKMDYRKLFDWHPDYTCIKHTINAHGSGDFTDHTNDWVATSVLRKSKIL